MTRTALPIAVLCLLALPVRAQAPPDPQALVDEGVAHFEHQRYREALERFRTAHAQAGDSQVMYLIGRCHEELGELDRALDAYRRFLTDEAAPAQVRTRVLATIRHLEARLQQASLRLVVEPVGATVLVDGVEVGRAPVETMALRPGRHTVEIRAEGRPAWVEEVELPAGIESTVRLAAPAAPEPPPPPPRPRYGIYGFVALGAALALAAGGTAAWVLGERDHAEVADSPGYGTTGWVEGLSWDRANELERSGDRRKAAGGVLLGIGAGALAAAGVLLGLEARVAAGALPVEGGAAVWVGRRF